MVHWWEIDLPDALAPALVRAVSLVTNLIGAAQTVTSKFIGNLKLTRNTRTKASWEIDDAATVLRPVSSVR
jgi:hypothetical protein